MGKELASNHGEAVLQKALSLLSVAKCPNADCDGGAIPVPLGEHFVSHEMAMDAGEPSMEGQSMGIEWGVEQCQWCDERKEVLAGAMARNDAVGASNQEGL